MSELCNKVGSIGQNNLIAKLFPPAEVTGVIIRAAEKETTLVRGTVMARSNKDGKLVVLGTVASGDDEVLTPAYILCDDTEIGTEDTPAVAYRTGNFNRDAVTVANDYTMTANDEDTLRKYGIVFSAMLTA
jgi:hypothetical protein